MSTATMPNPAFLAALQKKAQPSIESKTVEAPLAARQVERVKKEGQHDLSLVEQSEEKYLKFRYQVDTLCKHFNVDKADLTVLAVECLFNQEIKPQ